MAEVQTQPGASAKDSILLILAIVAVISGIVAFYWYDEAPLLARVALVVGGLVVAGVLGGISSYGRDFWAFAQAARIELRKVVWPSREETGQTTLVVFIFAALMGVFFFLLDLVLTWMTKFIGGQ
jgi:preprotein translocase subunit SecE